MAERVFLTGATGFIGSHVARLLVRRGEEVHALIRPGSNLWRIEDIAPQLRVVPCDLSSAEELEAHLARIRPDLCLHLAWYAEPGRYLTSPENIRLLQASLRLASCLAGLGCRRFIGGGTCFEYDTHLGYLSENSPTRPRTLYAASKVALHLVLAQIGEAAGMQMAWLRFFYLYGPFEDERRLVPYVILSLLRDRPVEIVSGDHVRDYLHVEDVAAAVLAVAGSDLTGAVNIGSGRPVTVGEVATLIGALAGRPERVSLGTAPGSGPPEMRFICADNERLRQAGWSPRYTLKEGLSDAIAWWRERLLDV